MPLSYHTLLSSDGHCHGRGVTGALPRPHTRLDSDLGNFAATSMGEKKLVCFKIKLAPSLTLHHSLCMKLLVSNVGSYCGNVDKFNFLNTLYLRN